jgi:hypothetical protein
MPRPKSDRRIALEEKGLIQNGKIRVSADRIIKVTSYWMKKITRQEPEDPSTLEHFNNLLEGKWVLTEGESFQLSNISDNKNFQVSILTNDDQKINIPINNLTIDHIQDLISSRYFEVQDKIVGGSDVFNNIRHVGINEIKIEEFIPTNSRENKDGGYFNKLNLTLLNLTKYQIYSENEDIEEHCFLHTLKECGVSQNKINQIKLSIINGCNLPRSQIHQICDIIKYKIILHFYNNNGKHMLSYYGKNYEEVINISLYKNHYFIYEKTQYTYNYINNYHDDLEYDYNLDSKKITSLNLVYLLDKNGHFKTYINKSIYNKEAEDTIDLLEGDISELQQEVKYKDRKQDKIIFVADCESDVSGKEHTPILIGIMKSTEDTPKIFKYDGDEQKLVTSFLRYIKKNTVNQIVRENKKQLTKVICFFHNLKYDFNGLIKKYCSIQSVVEKGGVLYSATVRAFGIFIELRDSYKIINVGLSKFTETLGLDSKYSKKEAIGYTYHTKENIISYGRIPVDDYVPFIHKVGSYTVENKEDIPKIREEFIKILENNPREFSYHKGQFSPQRYYAYYLKYDVLVLNEGLKKFDNILTEITSKNDKEPLSLYDYLTISSIADTYMLQNGAYDDVYNVRGTLREFCSKAVYGGRVNVNKKYQKKVITEVLQDFDGVSLYPSAIKRMCDEMGIPKGKAKVIESFKPNNYDYYIVKIRLLKINKTQDNPFIGIKDKDGILQYVNSIEEPIILHLDKIMLEDYIEFHNIEFEFIQGIYWNEGFNKKMGDLILELFESRLYYKSLMKSDSKNYNGYNAIQNITKKYKQIDGNPAKDYIFSNFNTIKEHTIINENQMEIKTVCMDNSANRGHVGCLILSYSKRIMNEVMNSANDNNIIIYYQDTDSIHMKDKNVCKLSQLYKEKYNRELIGKNLGQFHGDFSLRSAKSDIVSIKSIFLGKKCYIDVLEGKDGENKIVNGFHMRMKGISPASLEYEAHKSYNGDYFKMYEALSRGKKINFVLNPYISKPSFEYTKTGIRTREQMEFTRYVQF